MSSVDLGNGISIEGSGGHAVRSNLGGRRGPLAADFVTDPLSFAVDDALREAEFVVAADTTIAAEPALPGRRGFGDEAAVEQPEVHVTVAEGENAVLLLENAEGVFRWQFADGAGEQGPARRGAAPDTLTFTLAPPAAGEAAAGGRRGLESVVGWVGDRLVSPIRVRVLRFVAGQAIDLVIKRMEGDLATGLIVLHGNDGQWAVAGAPPQLATDVPARVLLLVHGTFSTTLGSYAALEASEQGRAFLARARAQYDLVIGFDHRTLAEDPKQNAEQILAALAFLPANSQIDGIAFSRGGLVYRALAEQLAPVMRPDLSFGRAVFVGCTNSGTLLAEPDNWKTLADLYTNVGVAGGRALSLLASPMAGTVVTQAVKLLGGFVKALPELAIEDGKVPGLAAMEPDGPFVQELNALPSPIERYYAVMSDFEPRIDLAHGLTGGLAKFLADRLMDRLLGEANDLVVNNASMTRFGEGEVLDPAQVHNFAPGETIYHTIYFLSPHLPDLLSAWLMPPLEGAPKNGGPPLEEPAAATPEPPPVAPPPEFERAVEANGGGRRGIPDDEREAAPFEPEPVGAEPPPPTAPREVVPCHFAAEMNPTPRLGSFAPLFVTVSRQALRVARNEAAAATEQPVGADASKPLTVEVLALANCRVWSDEADPATPETGASVLREIAVPDKSDVLRFLVEGADPGVARVQIEVTQGPHGLVSFILEPTFVDPAVTRLAAERVATPISPDADYPAVLRIYEQKVPGVGLVLKYDLACIDPNIAVKEDVTLPESFSVGAFASEFLQALNDAWQLSGEQYANFKERISSYSVNRTNELIPPSLRQALWDNWDKLEAIQVFAENPYIPWELLYIDDPSGQNPREDGFLGQRGLVRWVYNAPMPGATLKVRGDRVRYVIPDYRNPRHKLANAQAEKDLLGTVFPGARAIEATSEAVRHFLADEAAACDVLHFSCHGDTEVKSVLSADLLMQGITDAQGNVVPDKLSAETVKRYARFAEGGPATMVFVNACETGQTGPSIAGVSGFADAFLRPNGKRGAAAFIGALWSIDDKLALGFAKEFYEGMANDGLTLVEAVKRARQAAQTRSDFTWLAYTVYGNPLSRITKE
jgi:hypothetical protein